MAVYPTLGQSANKARTPDMGVHLDQAEDGALRGREMFSEPTYSFDFDHPLITAAERDTLMAFYLANSASEFTFTWNDDSSQYTVLFAARPVERRIAYNRYTVRVQLVGRAL